jgi:hypothetical protein
MNNVNNSSRLITVLILACICTEANAYIDPGTGSLLLQGLIAGIAAGAYTLKLYWYKFKSFFSRKDDDEKELEEE